MAERVSIGFKGGQVLSVRCSAEALAELQASLEQGGWQEVAAEDGAVRVYAPEVVYVRVERAEPHVGFGAS